MVTLFEETLEFGEKRCGGKKEKYGGDYCQRGKRGIIGVYRKVAKIKGGKISNGKLKMAVCKGKRGSML